MHTRARTHSSVLVFALLFALVRPAAAQTGSPPAGAAPGDDASSSPLPPDSWAGQLVALAARLAPRRHEAQCEAHCYTLQRLRLSGSLLARERGALRFELEGGVLAAGAV